jgi:hypothetical protein
MSETKKKKPFAIDREQRQQRQQTTKRKNRTLIRIDSGKKFTLDKTIETSPERAESLQIVREMAQAFIGTIEYYKADYGGSHSHDEAIKQAESMNEWRRQQVENQEPSKISWADIAAIGEKSIDDSLIVWARIRDAADDELECGGRAAQVSGNSTTPFELAQFLAIRDAFADQWQPQGGIESAMIDMLTISFSLQMYWSQIAHRRAVDTHNNQEKDLRKWENKGWKSPYQYEANAIEQAYKLADSYNRQFLRVLRQLRDLRRYAPVIIQNNGGQVNIGEQQVNIKPE